MVVVSDGDGVTGRHFVLLQSSIVSHSASDSLYEPDDLLLLDRTLAFLAPAIPSLHRARLTDYNTSSMEQY
jgi:hypothetical protein